MTSGGNVVTEKEWRRMNLEWERRRRDAREEDQKRRSREEEERKHRQGFIRKLLIINILNNPIEGWSCDKSPNRRRMSGGKWRTEEDVNERTWQV